MADPSVDHVALIRAFCTFSGGSTEEAQHFLAAHAWNLEPAVAEYFLSLEDGSEPSEGSAGISEQGEKAKAEQSEPSQAGPRTLGGQSVPQRIPTTSSAAPAPRIVKKKKFATLDDLGGGNAGHAGHGHDDDLNESDEGENRDLFAGGEKSALAVHNPASPEELRRKILEKARKNRGRPDVGGNETPAPATRFTGTARTLGGDNTPSEIIPDPNAAQPRTLERVQRHLHFWADGISVDDGPLFRSDDPANAQILNMIRLGRAPLEIMKVTHQQEVDVKVEQHPEKYVQSKKKNNPFGSVGQRLGSPVPGAGSIALNISTPAATPALAVSSTYVVYLDEASPTVSLQVRLGDGTRLVSRFNTSHTVGDIYAFVDASSPTRTQRAYTLMTTFPSKELSDKSMSLGDLSEFKRGGVVVQKWV